MESSKSLHDKLDTIIDKLENVKITNKWQPVIDFCEREDLDPEGVLKLIALTRDVALTSKTRREERERLKNS